MTLFDPTAYAFDPGGLPFLVTGLLALCVGLATTLYERFSGPSLRVLSLTLFVAGWAGAFGLGSVARTSELAGAWLRAGVILEPFIAPALYSLALHLTGRRRDRLRRALWVGAAGFALLGASGVLVPGVLALHDGRLLHPYVALAALMVAFLAVGLAASGVEFARAARLVRGKDRRRHLAMLAAVGVGALALADFFGALHPLVGAEISPLAVGAATLAIAFAATRYRAFSLAATLGTDEVLRAIGDAVLVCDANGVVRAANPGAERLLGMSEWSLSGVALGRILVDRRSPGEGPAARGWAAPGGRDALAQDRPARDREMCLLPADGEPVAVSVSLEPVHRGGRFEGAVIVARDIRDRMAAEEALRSSQLRYGSLFWHNPSVAYEITPGGLIASANPAAQEFLGVPEEALIGRPFGEFLDPAGAEPSARAFAEVLAGESREYEVRIRAAGGELRTLRGVSIPVLEGGRVVGVFGVAVDTTDEDRARRELEIQKRYLSELFEGSPEAIVVADHENRVVRINGEFTRMFGYTLQELCGRDVDELIVPEGREDEARRLSIEGRSGRVVRAETVRRRKDGALVEVSVLARDIRLPGEPPQMYAIYRDIGDRKRAEQQLREREEELRHAQKLEAVGQLAGGIAHDFNNLLTAINGHARLVLEDPAFPGAWRSDLEDIERAGTRAAELTQQLLAFGRRQVVRRETVELDAVIRDLERMLTRLIGDHIRLGAELDAAGAGVHADRSQLEQVVINLVVNARDAMRDGGALTLATDLVRFGPGSEEVAPRGVAPGTYVRLRVIDTGVGMDRAILERAFEPFFTTKEPGRGTGLGLPTVFGIVRQSGGHVWAESAPGHGAQVSVLLPARLADPRPGGGAAHSGAAAPPGGVAATGTVLVVEDEPAVRGLTRRVLERAGYRVLGAANGLEALGVLDRQGSTVDLVLSDIVMPEMGGRQLAAALARRRPDLPILFMSGYDDERVHGEADDGIEVLQKPFTPARLAERVAAALANVAG